MASTYSSLFYHIVFGTKYREQFIKKEWQEDLYNYLAGSIKSLGGVPEQIGGVEDHVHILLCLRPTICISDFMRELKKSSSIWARDNKCSKFQWQEGYAIFTVGASARDKVRKYIQRQEEHHKSCSYHDEIVMMLDKAGVTCDPRYLD